jgi:hypothetical protein
LERWVDALFVDDDSFFNGRQAQIVALAEAQKKSDRRYRGRLDPAFMIPETAQALEVNDGVDDEIKRSDEERDDAPPPEKEVHRRELPELLTNTDAAHIAPDRSFKTHDDRADIAGEFGQNRSLVGAADLTAHVSPFALPHPLMWLHFA